MNRKRYNVTAARDLVMRVAEGTERRCEACAVRRTRRRMDVAGVVFAVCESCAPVPVMAILPARDGADSTCDRADFEDTA
ncbi:hypothetical protein ACXC9Q_18745 [Kribbella sp. CWNU-51]